MTLRGPADLTTDSPGGSSRVPGKDDRRGGGGLPAPISFPVLWVAVLYLVVTSRWGSYVSLPEAPVFIGDVLLAVAILQTARHLRRGGSSLEDVGRSIAGAGLPLQLAVSLLVWAGVRGAAGLGSVLDDPLVGLRDAAPYAYALAALTAFLLPASAGRRSRALIYGALTAHVVWVLVDTLVPGGPWESFLLRGTTPIFSTRPDFDSAVAGAAIAFALHDILLGSRPRHGRILAALGAFALANGAAVLSLQTRAGLLAGVVGIGAVLLVWATRGATLRAGSGGRLRVIAVLVAAVAILGGAVTLSPPGQRLVESVRGQESQALGTVQVREYAWTGVTEYILADARRTAVGVGFGPDFIQDSGTAYSLEGSEYADVRSPHNYVLGTLARLGVAGALLVLLLIGAGAVLSVRRLADSGDAVTVLAALLVLGLPVTALLGVVLESPFGAIPYFWAIGQLARASQGVEGST